MSELSFEMLPLTEVPQSTGGLGEGVNVQGDYRGLSLSVRPATDIESEHQRHLNELLSGFEDQRTFVSFYRYKLFQLCTREFTDILSDVEFNRVQLFQREAVLWTRKIFLDTFRVKLEHDLFDRELTPPTTGNPGKDFEWFLAHQDELTTHAGQYVAILDGQIIAHGSTMADVINQSSKLNLPRRPLVSYVAKKGAVAFSAK